MEAVTADYPTLDPMARPIEHGEAIHELLRSAVHRAQYLGSPMTDGARQAEIGALLNSAAAMHDLATGESVGTLTIRRRWLDALGMDVSTDVFHNGRAARSFVRAMATAGHKGWHPEPE